MNVLITGVTGFVASHLSEFLLDKQLKDLNLYGTKRWRSPMENIMGIADKINFIDMELHDFNSVRSAIEQSKPDIIFHLAAQSFVPAGSSQPESTIDTNSTGTLRILEAVRLADINPVIHIASTADIYANVKKEGIIVDENTLPRPPNLYAVSKLTAENIALQFHDSYGLKTIVSRMLTHTGPRRGVAFVESDFAKQIAEIEKGIRPARMYVGNLSSIRTFLDVRDAVEAYYLLTQKCRAGEIYNICGRESISIQTLLDRLIALSKAKDKIEVEVDKNRFRPNDSFRPGLNTKKFNQKTGWKPKIGFDKTLLDLLNYWRKKLKDGK
jgi:GDP-mannose 4,6-dehydratase